jgi:hypothetical protein
MAPLQGAFDVLFLNTIAKNNFPTRKIILYSNLFNGNYKHSYISEKALY